MKRIRRRRLFLENVTREANRYRREALLQHAKADEVNALSELSLNLLKNRLPVTPETLGRLTKHKTALRQVGNRRLSLKARRQALLKQKGGAFWRGMNDILQSCYHRPRPLRRKK